MSDTPAPAGTAAQRQRATHSLETVVAEAVALLDEAGEAGEAALTFRTLAARLGGGVGSIYWYVSGKDDLVRRASDHVLAGVLAATEGCTGSDDPVDDLRAIAVAFYDAVQPRPWLGAFFMRDTGVQPHGLLLLERLGQQVMRLPLTPGQHLSAVFAVLSYVIGSAADQSASPHDGDGPEAFAAQWRAADAETHPFLRHVADVFAGHDDAEQFREGLDLLLDGIRAQARG